MNKLLIFTLMSIFLFSFTSALSFDNVKEEIQIDKGEKLNFEGKQIEYNDIWDKYKPIKIDNNFGFGSTLLEGYIEKHEESCGQDCESIFVLKTYEDSVLIDDVKFLRQLEDNSWVNGQVRSYQFYIYTGETQVSVNDYEVRCSDLYQSQNGTIVQDCERILIGSHLENAPEWSPYNLGDVKPSGNYKIKLEANKRADWTYDWQITTQGKVLSEWAIWGSGAVLIKTNTTEVNSFGDIINSSDTQVTTTSGTFVTAKTITGVNDYVLGIRFKEAGDVGSQTTEYYYATFLLANGTTYTTDTSEQYNCNIPTYCDVGWDLPEAYSKVKTSTITVYFRRHSSYSNTAYLKDLKVYGYNNTEDWDLKKSITINNYLAYIVSETKVSSINSTPSYIRYKINLVNGTEVYTSESLVNWTDYTNGTIPNPQGIQVGNVSSVDLYLKRGGQGGYLYQGNIYFYGNQTGNIYLNSPTNNQIMTTKTVTTNASAVVTGGAYLVNATLYDNSTGSWGARNMTNLASNFTEQTGFSMTTSVGDASYVGHQIYTKNAVKITGVNIVTGTGLTTCKIRDNSNNDLATASVVGNTATFNYQTTINTFYRVVCSGTTYKYGGAFSGVSGTYINYTNGILGTSIENSNTRGIQSIQVEVIPTSSTQTFNNTYPSGSNILWNYQFCDSDGDCGFATSNYTFSVDSVAPSIALNYPTALINYGAVNGTLQLNLTATDSSLDDVWYNYNGTNVTISGATSGVYNLSNITLSTKKNITIYANDTAGNLNTTTFSWDYNVFENSQSYNAITTEGAIESFSVNLTVNSGIEISSGVFHYNGTTGSPSISSSGSIRVLNITSFEIPSFASTFNVTFYWTLTLNDATVFNTSTKTQLVQNAALDNCSSFTNQLFNLFLLDERAKTPINGTIEVLYEILNVPSYNVIQNLTGEFSGVSQVSVCSELNLTGQNFVYSAQIKYYSNGYASELYNIQRGTIAQVSNISLYDLNSTQSTEFLIKYQDDDLIRVADAVIQLMRKYIPENTYEVVEAPLTSDEGTAVVHIDLDTNIYKVIVVKNGVILDIFYNMVFNCESELSGQCEQNLYGSLNPQNEIPIETLNDFSYLITQEGNNTLDITFSVPTGEPSIINILLTQKDIFGNTTLCNQTIISSGGSVECTYNDSITESYLDLIITKDGIPQAIQSYVVEENSTTLFFGNNFFIVFIFLLSIIGMAFTSPEWIIINAVATMFISGALYLLNGLNFVVGLGGLMWLVIGAGILIMKISKQEDR